MNSIQSNECAKRSDTWCNNNNDDDKLADDINRSLYCGVTVTATAFYDDDDDDERCAR